LAEWKCIVDLGGGDEEGSEGRPIIVEQQLND